MNDNDDIDPYCASTVDASFAAHSAAATAHYEECWECGEDETLADCENDDWLSCVSWDACVPFYEDKTTASCPDWELVRHTGIMAVDRMLKMDAADLTLEALDTTKGVLETAIASKLLTDTVSS